MEKTCDFFATCDEVKVGGHEQPPEEFYKKGVLNSFAKYTEKHLCQSLFLIKLLPEANNFINIQNLAQVFSCELCEIFKNTFFTEHL